jgi:methylmalonyl-CoA/ethylmalonyl-CoA epimerase
MTPAFAWAKDGPEVDHVGFLVESFEQIGDLFRDLLGMETNSEELPDHALRVLWVRCGEVDFEFLAPTDPDIPAAARLRRRGPGLDHIAVEVDSVAESLKWCRSHGVPLLDETPRPGAKGSMVAFLDPDGVGGTRIELVEPANPASTGRGREED